MTYKYRNTTNNDKIQEARERIEALEIECDGIGEDECAELVRLRAWLAEQLTA